MKKSIIVIGGGPAGMMAAIAASGQGMAVTLLEKNEKLGKKLYITGKGRGNFTNTADIRGFLDKTVSNSRFLHASFHRFSNEDLLSFMEKNGCAWKEERGGRVFPVSDHASDITKALEKALRQEGVRIRLNSEVKGLICHRGADGEKDRIKGAILSSGEELYADHTIVATGGLSYPSCGSTGDGLSFAEELGISISEPSPALVPLETAEEDIFIMKGLSLKNINLIIRDEKNKKCFSGFGELLFTHFGVSGPLVLSASSILSKRLIKGERFFASIDLKPAVPEDELDKRLIGIIKESRQRSFGHFFDSLIPNSMRKVMVQRSHINPAQKIGEISKAERKQILSLLKDFRFTIKGSRGFSEAVITQGGISVKELDPKTLKVKKMEGLSFAGEVIDVDAYTGGYNLQIAFSTGFVAGEGVLSE